MAAHWKRSVVGRSAVPGRRAAARKLSPHLALVLPVLALVIAGSLVCFGRSAWSQAFPRVLEDIKLYGRGETIQMVFSQPYEGMPTEEYLPGRMSLTFVGVGSAKPVRDLRPREESLYKDIKVVQNRYSTTVTFLLRDSKLNLKERVSFSRDKNLLNVDIRLNGDASPAAAPPAARPAGEPLLSEMEQKIAGLPAQPGAPPGQPPAPQAAKPVAQPPVAQSAAKPAGPISAASALPAPKPAAEPAAPAALGLGGMPETSFFATLATMVVALAIMLGGLYGILYLYKRYFHSRLARFAGTPAMRQIASFSIGPRQRIVILEINGEWIACGVTPSQITFLTRLTGRQPAAHAESPDVAESATGGTADAGPAALPAKPDPVHQFAEVLKQKVRSLKRIN